jgi:mevalonate kinase
MPDTTQSAHVSVPGKLILVGEHAVVYGQPAIAVPLHAVQATAAAEPGPPGSGIVIHAPDVGEVLYIRTLTASKSSDDLLYNALAYPIHIALHAFKRPVPDLAITIRSTIPIASGLGSGAALATALVRALAEAIDYPLANDALNALIYEVEKRHHGTPSGIDNTVIVYEEPVYFVRDEPIRRFTIARPFTLLVADTGVSSPTRLAVADVRALYDAKPQFAASIFDRIGQIARDARAAIESGTIESLGPLMNENHYLLRELDVSSGGLDRLCDAARAAGALGAKLSGGGRGGNMIALAAPDRLQAAADALREAGAVRVIQTEIATGS